MYAGANQLVPAYSLKKKVQRDLKTIVRIYSAAMENVGYWTTDGQVTAPNVDPSAVVGYGGGCQVLALRGENPVVGWRSPYGFGDFKSAKLRLTVADAEKVFSTSRPAPARLAIPALYVLDANGGDEAYVHGIGVRKVRRLRVPFSVLSAEQLVGHLCGNKTKDSDRLSRILEVLFGDFVADAGANTVYIGRIDPAEPITDKLIDPATYNGGVNRYSCEVAVDLYEEGMSTINEEALRVYGEALQNNGFSLPQTVI